MYSRIIVARIKPCLEGLVGKQQSAFVPGRHIADNILLMQELVRGYHRGAGPARCALKIDIQKAYDTVEWVFLKDVLVAMRFLHEVVGWIMTCVTSPFCSISLSGYLEGYFKDAKGLRQGDPLSPYLFILIMEAFSFVLEEHIQQDGFVFHLKCKELNISHLELADDMFIMCSATAESLQIVKHAIDDFGNILGLRPNLQKSNIFFPGVSDDEKVVLSALMRMEVKELPIKYLGVPLISTRLKARDCEAIKGRILQRIQSWTSKYLSYAGRVQLVVSVLHSIQAYWSTMFVLPKKVLKDIDSVLTSFIWTGADLRKTGAKVA